MATMTVQKAKDLIEAAEQELKDAEMQLETKKKTDALQLEEKIMLDALLEKLSAIKLRTASIHAELADNAEVALPAAKPDLFTEIDVMKLFARTRSTKPEPFTSQAEDTSQAEEPFIKKVSKAKTEKAEDTSQAEVIWHAEDTSQAEEPFIKKVSKAKTEKAEDNDTESQPDPITYDKWLTKMSPWEKKLMKYPDTDPSEAGKLLAINIADLGFNDKRIITGECSKKLKDKYPSLYLFYDAFYYEFNAAGKYNEDISMLVVSEPISLFGTFTVLFSPVEMIPVFGVMNKYKFDVLSAGTYINKEGEEMMRITAIKQERRYLANLNDIIEDVNEDIVEITHDNCSKFYYVNQPKNQSKFK